METTLLLAKVFGLYCLIGSIAVLTRQSYFIPVIGAFIEERLTRLVVSMFELVGGLFIVVTHQLWSPAEAAIISIIGWAMTIEGAAFLLLPDAAVADYIRKFNNKSWYTFGGILGIVIGIYLSGRGFGWF